MIITAEKIRNTADRICGTYSVSLCADHEDVFMCYAWKKEKGENLFDGDPEFYGFLKEAGLKNVSGDLFSCGKLEYTQDEYYQKNAQPVRFMLLDLLAYMLEDEENART